jgi:hypothetical protein
MSPEYFPPLPSVPEPGQRCDKCHRRVPKKRESKSPETKRIIAVLPPDRAEALAEGLDNLQEYAGIDGESYPRGVLLEYLLALGAIHREELKAYFRGYGE